MKWAVSRIGRNIYIQIIYFTFVILYEVKLQFNVNFKYLDFIPKYYMNVPESYKEQVAGQVTVLPCDMVNAGDRGRVRVCVFKGKNLCCKYVHNTQNPIYLHSQFPISVQLISYKTKSCDIRMWAFASVTEIPKVSTFIFW